MNLDKFQKSPDDQLTNTTKISEQLNKRWSKFYWENFSFLKQKKNLTQIKSFGEGNFWLLERSREEVEKSLKAFNITLSHLQID